MNDQTKARYTARLHSRIHELYGTKIIPDENDESYIACERFIDLAAEVSDPSTECQLYLAWLSHALRNRKEEHPPLSPAKACIEIETYASRAAAWSKFKSEKATLMKPRFNPNLKDDRPDEAIPTKAEYEQFLADLRHTVAHGLNNEIRERYRLTRISHQGQS